MSIRVRYEQELKHVYDTLILMCRQIESAIENSIKALIDRDADLAQEVYEGDVEINRLERDIEKRCLKILLLQHPVASDFREVSATLKMVTDLERIGDQARDIANIIMQFGDEEYCKKLEHIPQMALIVTQMVSDGVKSLIDRDLELARSLETTDDKVDALFKIIKRELIELIQKNPDIAEQAILFLMISKYLERIGDHAINIGEWVEYAITGKHVVKRWSKNGNGNGGLKT